MGRTVYKHGAPNGAVQRPCSADQREERDLGTAAPAIGWHAPCAAGTPGIQAQAIALPARQSLGRIIVFTCSNLVHSPAEKGLPIQGSLFSVRDPGYADIRDDGQCGIAKRMECVQLAGAIAKGGRPESGSKLHALQTLRAGERLDYPTMRHRNYERNHLGRRDAGKGWAPRTPWPGCQRAPLRTSPLTCTEAGSPVQRALL